MEVGLVFGIIFTAIIIGFLLFFGFKYINEMFGVNCEAVLGDQIIKLRDRVGDTFQLSMGATQEFTLIVPNCIEKICFVNPGDPSSYGNWETNNVINNMILAYGYNMIVFNEDKTFNGHKIDHLTTEYNFCVSSKKNLLLKNDGSFVVIELE